MPWSLTLSPRLSPAVLLGVSYETFPTARPSHLTPSAPQDELSRRFSSATNDFPKQQSAHRGTPLALGARTETEELTITAA
ncbi:MAG: hypothetical protein JWP75_4172 [Frondihabitans sp.]|nr:hypothetical protein [Frondihabitans sp.]